MAELADIFRACGAAYQEKYALLPNQCRAMRDICACRTEPLGGQIYWCKVCQCYRYCYHSCCNRHCPKSQNNAATEWISKQSEHLLPVLHFMVTATLPECFRPMAYNNQKRIYGLMCQTAAAAIQKLARDPRFVGGEVGIIAILQTWTRDLRYHPHVHFIVTGGGLAPDGSKWLPIQRDYLMPARALARIFRAKFRDALKKTDLFDQVSAEVWRKDWVIDIQQVG